MKRRVACVLLLALAAAGARAEVQTVKPEIPLTPQQEALYRGLLPELRCLVCQNESLAESQASLAADLRYEVRGLVAKGEDETAIKKYLTDRYGDFVLYKPPLEARTALLWAAPFLLVLIGLTMLFAYARRTRATPATRPPADEAALRKILDDHS
ncbi:MAG: cytochrome c-type biogenesis protein CcmH [Nevskia sp.]|nr:cytochrome c-type biogenesis protein CcmH [Nevskia sp.]